MKTVILWSCIGLSAAILVASYSLRKSSEATPEHRSEAVPEVPEQVTAPTPRRGSTVSPRRTPAPAPEQSPAATAEGTIEEVKAFVGAWQSASAFAHHRKIADERIEELRKESFEESFIRLQDDQSYIPEGLLSGTVNPKMDLQRMFSNRGFLKVFQEFKVLPREEALEKLNEFWERAVGEYEASTEISLLLHDLVADPTKQEQYEELVRVHRSHPRISNSSEKCAFYAPMLLAAYMGENALLASMIDEAKHITDTAIDRLGQSDTVPLDVKNTILPEDSDGMYPTFSLEENALLSILVYAAERTGVDLSEADIPFDHLTQEVIPLFPWDAEWTHYDYPVYNERRIRLDSNDADELFTVYSFPRYFLPGERFFDEQERKTIIDTVKDVLSR